MRSYRYIYILVLLVFTSCNTPLIHNKIEEGVIEYDIHYLQDEKENPVISLMPNTLKMSFKENHTILKMEGWMGIFVTAVINNLENNSSATLLKVMNKKYCYLTTLSDPPIGFDPMPGMQVTFLNNTKEILGYPCKGALISYLDSNSKRSFEIYYTEFINIKDPNKGTIYFEIPGVLMEFRLSMKGIPMQLKARKIEGVKVLDEEFNIPQDYEQIDRKKIIEIIDSLM